MPEDALPPVGDVLMTHAGSAVFEAVTGEVVDGELAARFYLGVMGGAGTLVWATRRRPTHDELVRAWPARTAPGRAELARGWWRPTIEVLRVVRREAASRERAAATRRAAAP